VKESYTGQFLKQALDATPKPAAKKRA